jgi:hypothetical protein
LLEFISVLFLIIYPISFSHKLLLAAGALDSYISIYAGS